MTERFTIVQLSPAALAVTGDRGNVLALQRRLEVAGHRVDVARVDSAGDLPWKADVVVIGNGPLSAVRTALPVLRSVRGYLSDWLAAGVPFLAVGGGMDALGREIRDPEAGAVEGLGLLPISVDRAGDRRVGYLAVDTPHGRIVGFEDHRATTAIEDGAEPFGIVSLGVTGSLGEREGVTAGAAIGTRVQGPVLPLNPELADAVLARALGRRGVEWAPVPGHLELDLPAAHAREAILAHMDTRFAHI